MTAVASTSPAGAAGNVVLGNFIGTDVTGTVGLGNALGGVEINGAAGNTVGGTTPGCAQHHLG